MDTKLTPPPAFYVIHYQSQDGQWQAGNVQMTQEEAADMLVLFWADGTLNEYKAARAVPVYDDGPIG